MRKERLWGLEVLRCLAFIAVVISHAGYDELNEYGAWGVSVFFVLSGFLLSYNYVDSGRIKETSFKSNLKFMFKKISRLYPLHVICTLLMLPFCFFGAHSEGNLFVMIKLILNLLMIQEWFPFAYNSINDVSWFLCSICFGYFMFPWFLRKLERRKGSTEGVLRVIGGILVFQIAVSFILNLLFGDIQIGGIFVDNLVYWLLYCFPLMRFIEIVIGYYLGYYFMYSWKEPDKAICDILEAACVILAVSTGLFLHWYFSKTSIGSWWWTCTVVFTWQVCVMVYVFAHSGGFISKLLNNRLTRFVSDISSYGFLIHYVVFDYLTTIVYLLFGREFERIYSSYINLSLGIILTVIGCVVWKYIANFIDKIRKLKKSVLKEKY